MENLKSMVNYLFKHNPNSPSYNAQSLWIVQDLSRVRVNEKPRKSFDDVKDFKRVGK